MEKWKMLWERFGKTERKQWMTRENLIVAVLTGVLLFVVALPHKGETKEEKENLALLQKNLWAEESESPQGGEGDSAGQAGSFSEQEQYARKMEERLRQVLCRVEGVGKTQVMITLKSSGELVLDRETPVKRSSTQEDDGQGGSRVISQSETGDAVVYRSSGSDSQPYVIKTMQPELEGVLVVAQGAGDAAVKRTVTAIVQALFDVEAHRVSVVKMESE